MTFIYTRGNPDNLVGGLPAAMNDIQGPLYDLRDYLNTISLGAPPLVAALPLAPSDGDEVYLKTGAQAPTWHMRFSSAWHAFDARGWEFLGGAPLSAVRNSVHTIATGSAVFVDPGSPENLQIAVGAQGEYLVHFGFYGYQTTDTTPQPVVAGVDTSSDPSVNDNLAYATSHGSNFGASVASAKRIYCIAPNLTLRMSYLRSAARIMNYKWRFIHATPTRLST